MTSAALAGLALVPGLASFAQAAYPDRADHPHRSVGRLRRHRRGRAHPRDAAGRDLGHPVARFMAKGDARGAG